MANLALDIKIEGVPQIQKKLDKNTLIAPALKAILSKGAFKIQRKLSEYSPVDTERLRSSWATKVDTSPVPMWSEVGTNVVYAASLEYSGKSPRGVGRIPFFEPAVSDSQSDINTLLDEARKMIEDSWGK